VTVTHTPTLDATERAHLARAVALAATVRGTTSPNPAVGCVVAHGDRVVGEGATRPAGSAHAEVVALAAAGAEARGATVLVTLEPCAHHGRTPPCTDALVQAGVARVVFAHADPNPQASGGADRLREAGIDVVAAPAVFRDAVAADLEGFLRLVTEGRPHVTLKLAQTLDGALVLPADAGDRRWITGPEARRAVHRWRAAVDAVLVGSGTVLADDPRLDVRDAPLGDRRQPRAVVLDGRLRTPATSQVARRGALILTRADAPRSARAALTAAGAVVVDVPGTEHGGVDPAAALRVLAVHGVASVLAEPGATLARTLLRAELVDRVVQHVALDPGAGPVRSVFARELAGWHTTRLGGVGPDLVWERVPATADTTSVPVTVPTAPTAPTDRDS
jgi:diaminohydroxyphosphoribosylaminopyrimidine deaminase / 5-amino-6-(5-phosphoribosylamino)uracil reductase